MRVDTSLVTIGLVPVAHNGFFFVLHSITSSSEPNVKFSIEGSLFGAHNTSDKLLGPFLGGPANRVLSCQEPDAFEADVSEHLVRPLVVSGGHGVESERHIHAVVHDGARKVVPDGRVRPPVGDTAVAARLAPDLVVPTVDIEFSGHGIELLHVVHVDGATDHGSSRRDSVVEATIFSRGVELVQNSQLGALKARL